MKINLNSGFGRGAALYSWNGSALVEVGHASENTRSGDGDSSCTAEVPEDFKGVIVSWRFDASTPVKSVDLLGFSKAELAAPSPVLGTVTVTYSCCHHEPRLVGTFKEYLSAVACQETVVPHADHKIRGVGLKSGSTVRRLGAQLGHQCADSVIEYALDGSILLHVGGGDCTPVLTQDGRLSTIREEDEAAQRAHAKWVADKRRRAFSRGAFAAV